MDIKNFQKKYKLSNSDIIRVISRKYPRFAKFPLYMVKNPRDYGVQLVPGAEDALRDVVSKKKPNRVKSCQLTVRITPEVFEIVEDIREDQGITMQELLERCLRWYCNAALAIRAVTKETKDEA